MVLRFFTAPARPESEASRLEKLRNLEVLDTPPDPLLDDLVKSAAAIFDAPIGLVSLVDSDRQWFKARCGLDATQTPRSVSFCGHAILQSEPLIILDARKDDRFAGNPLVIGNPTVIFYVGMPLVTADGHAVGTLCVIDSEPRGGVEEAQLTALKALADQVIARLDNLS